MASEGEARSDGGYLAGYRISGDEAFQHCESNRTGLRAGEAEECLQKHGLPSPL